MRSKKAALAHDFEALVEEGLRAFNVELVHAGDMTLGRPASPTRSRRSSPPSARCR